QSNTSPAGDSGFPDTASARNCKNQSPIENTWRQTIAPFLHTALLQQSAMASLLPPAPRSDTPCDKQPPPRGNQPEIVLSAECLRERCASAPRAQTVRAHPSCGRFVRAHRGERLAPGLGGAIGPAIF